jgi:FkbM family methyltransferase
MSSGQLIVSIYNKLRKHGVDINRLEDLGGWIFDTFKRGHVKLDGLKFEIPKDATTRRLRARFLTDAHEISERTLARNHIAPEACVLELGGGLGIVACMVNNMLNTPTAHVVVDPDPRSLAAMERNKEINGASYQLVQGIISDQQDQVMFFAPNSISSSQHLGQEADRTPVTSLSIEGIQQDKKLKFDSYIIDIEGSEFVFAHENEAHLREAKVVIMEFHPRRIGEDKCQKIRDIFTRCGLHLAETVNDVEAWRRTPLN